MVILSQAPKGEGATTIPTGSRVQVDSKRTASQVDDDIVCALGKPREAHRKRVCRNITGKHVVGSDHTMDAWNEASRRYVTMLEEFYVPVFRVAPENKKQGSGGVHENSAAWQVRLESMQRAGLQMYEVALADGVAPELARCFLPADCQYVVWRWATSLQAVAHFLTQRLDEHAQWEIRQYADAVYQIAAERFPVSIAALVEVAQ